MHLFRRVVIIVALSELAPFTDALLFAKKQQLGKQQGGYLGNYNLTAVPAAVGKPRMVTKREVDESPEMIEDELFATYVKEDGTEYGEDRGNEGEEDGDGESDEDGEEEFDDEDGATHAEDDTEEDQEDYPETYIEANQTEEAFDEMFAGLDLVALSDFETDDMDADDRNNADDQDHGNSSLAYDADGIQRADVSSQGGSKNITMLWNFVWRTRLRRQVQRMATRIARKMARNVARQEAKMIAPCLADKIAQKSVTRMVRRSVRRSVRRLIRKARQKAQSNTQLAQIDGFDWQDDDYQDKCALSASRRSSQESVNAFDDNELQLTGTATNISVQANSTEDFGGSQDGVPFERTTMGRLIYTCLRSRSRFWQSFWFCSVVKHRIYREATRVARRVAKPISRRVAKRAAKRWARRAARKRVRLMTRSLARKAARRMVARAAARRAAGQKEETEEDAERKDDAEIKEEESQDEKEDKEEAKKAGETEDDSAQINSDWVLELGRLDHEDANARKRFNWALYKITQRYSMPQAQTIGRKRVKKIVKIVALKTAKRVVRCDAPIMARKYTRRYFQIYAKRFTKK